MPFIEVRTTLRDHRKAKAAARALGVHRAQLIGHLVCLWQWAIDNVPSTGSLEGIEEADIEEAALWPEDRAGDLMPVLRACGWVDSVSNGQGADHPIQYLHDWDDYAGRLLRRREADRDRKRTEREVQRTGSVASTGQATKSTTSRAQAPARRRAGVHRTAPSPVQTPTVQRSTEGAGRGSGKGSGGNPATAPGAQPSRSRSRGARSPLLDVSPDDERYPVAEVLARRYRYREVTPDQWSLLWEEADNEAPVGTKAAPTRAVTWAWMAAWLKQLPKEAGDPIEALIARQRVVKGERLAKADQAEEHWQREKQAPPTHAGLAQAAKHLANGSPTPAARRKPTKRQRQQAIAMLRQFRGLVEPERWRQQLEHYGLTEADIA